MTLLWDDFTEVFVSPQNKSSEYISTHSGFHYLLDEGVECEGLYVYGSPWQPYFYNWAFNLQRGKQCVEKWKAILKELIFY